jgi:hypothetical protein
MVRFSGARHSCALKWGACIESIASVGNNPTQEELDLAGVTREMLVQQAPEDKIRDENDLYQDELAHVHFGSVIVVIPLNRRHVTYSFVKRWTMLLLTRL